MTVAEKKKAKKAIMVVGALALLVWILSMAKNKEVVVSKKEYTTRKASAVIVIGALIALALIFPIGGAYLTGALLLAAVYVLWRNFVNPNYTTAGKPILPGQVQPLTPAEVPDITTNVAPVQNAAVGEQVSSVAVGQRGTALNTDDVIEGIVRS